MRFLFIPRAEISYAHFLNKFYEFILSKNNKYVYNHNCTIYINTVNTDWRGEMFNLDVRSRKPIYEQLVDKFKELIINEVLKVDEQLPSVRVLAQQLTINPNTIQKAYRELERQGYIYSMKGKGSFVNSSPEILNKEKLQKVKQELMKIIAEAMYLGMTRDDLYSFISEIEKSVGGGDENDPS